MIRPAWASVYSENAANTSAIRANSFFSSSFRVSHGRTWSPGFATSSGIGFSGVSAVPSGTMPFVTISASTHSR